MCSDNGWRIHTWVKDPRSFFSQVAASTLCRRHSFHHRYRDDSPRPRASLHKVTDIVNQMRYTSLHASPLLTFGVFKAHKLQDSDLFIPVQCMGITTRKDGLTSEHTRCRRLTSWSQAQAGASSILPSQRIDSVRYIHAPLYMAIYETVSNMAWSLLGNLLQEASVCHGCRVRSHVLELLSLQRSLPPELASSFYAKRACTDPGFSTWSSGRNSLSIVVLSWKNSRSTNPPSNGRARFCASSR